MKTLFDGSSRNELLERLRHLAPDKQPLWGRMTAHEMVCHLNVALRQCLGEVDLGKAGGPLSHWPLNWLAIHVMPWPKGAKTAPGLLGSKPATWDSDLDTLSGLVEKFGKRDETGPWPPSVVFGRISGRSWGVLEHRHLDHHLRQFGL